MSTIHLNRLPDGWNQKPIGELAVFVRNGFVGTATSHYTEDEDGILYIQGYNVRENSFNLNGIKRITPSFHSKNSKSALEKGDLLTIQTGDVGLTTIVPEELAGSNCHALIITRLEQEICHPPFFAHYLNSYEGRNRLRRIETGSTMKHLNVKEVKKWFVPHPPRLEQVVIGGILSRYNEFTAHLEKLFIAKEEQKRGLMQQLLTGKKRFSNSAMSRGRKSAWGMCLIE